MIQQTVRRQLTTLSRIDFAEICMTQTDTKGRRDRDTGDNRKSFKYIELYLTLSEKSESEELRQRTFPETNGQA